MDSESAEEYQGASGRRSLGVSIVEADQRQTSIRLTGAGLGAALAAMAEIDDVDRILDRAWRVETAASADAA